MMMKMKDKVTAYFTMLEGSATEIGRQQGLEVKRQPQLLDLSVLKEELPAHVLTAKKRIFESINPSWNEELGAFAEELQVPSSKLIYYANTQIASGCSHCAVLPNRTADKRTYVLRTYDLAPHMDDMRLCSTRMTGAYTHTGFSIQLFGRSEGMNEHGLCVTFSACGQPVGDLPGMRKPRAEGLQFWAVVRLLLEKCSTVSEALDTLKEIPIASNMNMLVTDLKGQTALIETYDGIYATRLVDVESEMSHLIATNHPLFTEVAQVQPRIMGNSMVRLETLERVMNQEERLIAKGDLLRLMETEYPTGLAIHNYEQWFGTLRSMLFDLEDRSVDVCFGSPLLNPWYKLKVGDKLEAHTFEVKLQTKEYGPQFWADHTQA
ncbi:C45 family autoproteolytic acyltransferase/hydolase [Paenibacillus marinisediminis]